MRPIRQMMALCLLTGLLAGCGMQNLAGDQSDNASGRAVRVSENAVRKEEKETKKIRYEAENREYGIALPELDCVMEDLEDLIYWSYATRPTESESDLYSYLEEIQALNQDLKVTLYYGEEEGTYFDGEDEEGRRYYRVLVHFQSKKSGFYLSFYYNARGLSFLWGDDLLDEDDEEVEETCKSYTKWGEAVLHIDESAAEQYVLSKEMDPQKEQIRKDCLKQIEEYRKDGKENNMDCDIYIYDLQPGNDWLEGRILYTNLQDGDVPVSWLHIHVCYKGKKMEKYNGITWYPRSSTMFNGGEYSLKAAKDALKELQDEMLPENCFMAYRIKDGKLSSLK